jgi:rSAM/selenodomain-associated transferase 1
VSAPPAVAIFARAPLAGACKTRLMPLLGPEGAAELHAALVRHALAQACAAGLGPVTLWCAPSADHPFFAACAAEFGVALAAQPDGDLGGRMLAAFAVTGGPLLIMGADCPTIGPRDLRACARALEEGADAVFLPAEDGGYGLVGAARPIAAMFAGIDWGGPQVMAQTRARLAAGALVWREERTVWDVDEPADYLRLQREAEALPGLRLPNRPAGE